MTPVKPLFQVTRRGPRPNRTVTLPLTQAACSAGLAFMEYSTPAGGDASEVVVPSNGTQVFMGFITRDVLAATAGVPTVPVPTYAELSLGAAPSLPLEAAFSAGLEASLEDADEYEAEGSAFVSSGNGATYDLTANTTIGTRLSFLLGTTCLAASGQPYASRAEFVLAEKLTPQVAGNLRIRCQRLYGDKI